MSTETRFKFQVQRFYSKRSCPCRKKQYDILAQFNRKDIEANGFETPYAVKALANAQISDCYGLCVYACVFEGDKQT